MLVVTAPGARPPPQLRQFLLSTILWAIVAIGIVLIVGEEEVGSPEVRA